MTTTVADAIGEALAQLGEGPAAIYNAPAWTAKREEYKALYDIYKGTEWEETTNQRDGDGKPVYRFPLQVNPVSKFCRLHRAVLFGMRLESTDLPVHMAVLGENNDASRAAAAHYQAFINDTWRDSGGMATLEEAGLLLQIYGGHFFKVAWEFWNEKLPYRIAVRTLKSPAYVFPIWDMYDEWNLLEAYIGYYISRDVAMAQFGIETADKEILYLEHWTTEEYKITVGDTVPKMKWGDEEYELAGENPWGVVPIVYIPHEREGGFYGRSLVKDLPGLTRELNARLADKGDAVAETAHRLLITRNTRTKGSFASRPIIVDGRRTGEALDIGDAPSLPGAQEPDLFAVESRGMAESVAGFPEELWDELRRQADVASVAMGDDDVSGGRITGPVTAYRMFPTISHTMTERSNFSMGLECLARIVGKMAIEREAKGAYKALGIPGPGITEEMLGLRSKQIWHPMIPIERLQRAQELTLRLQANGISLITYLRELGVDDPEQEAENIWEDIERKMELEAKLKAAQGEQGGNKQTKAANV